MEDASTPVILVIGYTRAAHRALLKRGAQVTPILVERPSEMPAKPVLSAFAEVYSCDYTQREAICDLLPSLGGIHVPTEILCLREFAVEAGAMVRSTLGLQGMGPETALAVRNKSQMKETLEAAGLPIAPWIAATAADSSDVAASCDALGWPVIIKPLACSGSAGVSLVADRNGLAAALERAFLADEEGRVLIERYVSGAVEISVEGVIWDTRIAYVQVTDKFTTGPPYFVEIGHIVPSSMPRQIRDRAIKLVAQGLSVLNVDRTVFHAELFVRARGQLVLGEIAARQPGDRIAELGQLATGYDMVGALIDLLTTGGTSETRLWDRAAAIRYPSPLRPRVVVKAKPTLPSASLCGIHELCYPLSPGDRIRPLESSFDRCGYVIATSSRPRIAWAKASLVTTAYLLGNSRPI